MTEAELKEYLKEKQSKLKEYLKEPEKYIPYGYYCDNCPFWDLLSEELYPYQENGYCHYLKKSDWDLNEERDLIVIQSKNKEEIGKKVKEIFKEEIDQKSNKKTHFPASLLWDECKECNINIE